jgi:hypothetical protein
MDSVEWNYPVHDKEMLAILDAFKLWRHHLEGAKHTVKVRTDNKVLKYFHNTHNLLRQQAQWQGKLAWDHY